MSLSASPLSKPVTALVPLDRTQTFLVRHAVHLGWCAYFRSAVSNPSVKPAIDWGDEVAGFGAPTLLASQPAEIADGAQFE